MAKDIFISYSRNDSRIADIICRTFDRVGLSYFIDRDGIIGGEDFVSKIAGNIAGCRVFLLLASLNSYESYYVDKEIKFAFENQIKNLLAYRLDGIALPKSLQLIFAGGNQLNVTDHSVTMLTRDICRLLGVRMPESTLTAMTAEEMYQRGYECYEHNDFEKALEWYHKAAETGHEIAQCDLGNMYRAGHGVKKNEDEGLKWIRRSAENGYVYAQTLMALMYFIGEIVDKDYGQAVSWYSRAADKGYVKAQYDLGWIYRVGDGVAKDAAKAVSWYRKAADQGDSHAQYQLAEMYRLGEGVEPDIKTARKLYHISALQGNTFAINRLSRL